MLAAMLTKNMWRAQMLTLRAELGPDKISQFNRDICKNLSFVWSEAGALASSSAPSRMIKPLWAGYKSFRWGADPSAAITDSGPYLRWAYPRTLENLQMEFREPASVDAVWTKNGFGIWEPNPHTSELININECIGVLVPGVAFDREGRRLGYGKGFYDRALAEFKGLKVGVGFSMQVTSDALPFDGTDITMDIIVTDKDVIHVKGHH